MRATSNIRNSHSKRRTFERSSAWAHAKVRRADEAQSVIVRDVSRFGIKLEYAYGLKPGDKIKIELTPSRVLDGIVAWSIATYCGVDFPCPLAEDDAALASCARS
jgi:hypothetical protein